MSRFCLICVVAFFAISGSVQAGFVGSYTGGSGYNDTLANVKAIVDAHVPDLQTNFSFLVKFEDDDKFPVDGFRFFKDATGSKELKGAWQFDDLVTAYFTYTGSQQLLYYSVKSKHTVSVYQYDPGVFNKLNAGTKGISHVSFWTGIPLPEAGDVVVPEPASLAMWGLGLAGLGFCRRRKTVA